MRNPHRSLWLALSVLSLSVFAGPATLASATSVAPVGELFTAENVGAVTFVTDAASSGTISCNVARISDLVPRSETNPNSAGSVIDDIGSISNSASFGECRIVGESVSLSGGAGGVPTIAWNVFGTLPIATMAFGRQAFLWTNNNPERGTCQITVGRLPVQSAIGTWTNSTAQVAFEAQNLYAEASGVCPFGSFDQVRFTGTFHVVAHPSLLGVTVR